MAYTHFERLTAIDAVFLEIEDPAVHMHVGAVALFEAEPLRSEGRVDVERIRRFTEAILQESPRFRQKLVEIPVLGQPAWVDDPRFNLIYHVRHTALPPPGSVRQLKRLAGRILSQKLDRGKPLWEMWVVEGVEGDRVAVIFKVHHCMVDGIAGIDLLASLLRLEPDTAVPESRPWMPRPTPTPAQMLAGELRHRATTPLSVLRSAPGSFLHPARTFESLRESALALGETIGAGLAPTSDTPLNPEIGPYRRFDWAETEIERVREIRKHLGGTLNDVVLSTVAGAVRRFMERRGAPPDRDTRFRVMVPVSVRKVSERGAPGNRVVNFLARLPIDEAEPRRRLARTIERTRALKDSRRVKGAEVLEEISDVTFTGVLVQFVRLADRTRAYNMVVTNVPGPPRPLYLLGARMTEIYPLVPLFHQQGLGIALFSYDGRLCWGFNADWDAMPDLHDFVEGLEAEFEALLAAARETAAPADAP